jgi:hypothetical protein
MSDADARGRAGTRRAGPPAYTGRVRNLDDVFAALERSPFRRRFRLGAREQAYLRDKGLPVVLAHAADFVAQRLAPAQPRNDGRQTPMRGHPAFIAQHATATCCRGCLAKWHGIAAGRELDARQQAHAVAAIERWLRGQPPSPPG